MTTTSPESTLKMSPAALLKDQVVVVTGATAGIGRGIALKMASEGARVVVIGTNPERGATVVAEIEELTGSKDRSGFYATDVASQESVNATVAQILADFGTVDVLVNNAGITRDGLLMRMTEDQWDDVVNVNLKSVYNTCRALARTMTKARRGRIVNISSIVGLTGNKGQVNYASSKAGMIGFTKSLAQELAPRNILVNAVAPGYIKTRMTEKLPAAIEEMVPLGRWGEPEDIANAVLFLASDMANYVTGQVIVVDGGLHT